MKKLAGLLFLISTLAQASSTFTTNYNLEKPRDGSTSWGSAIRNGLDTIDTQLFINATGISDHIVDTVDAHDASAISSIAGATVCTTGTDVQTYLTCLSNNIGSVIGGDVATLTTTQTFTGSKTFAAPVTFSLFGAGLVHSSSSGLLSSSTLLNADVNASAAIDHSKMAALTVSRAMVTNGSGVASASSVTSTELGYLSGVTSALQTQLNAKQTTTLPDGTILIGNGSNVATSQSVTGDISITNTGVTSIGTGIIVNADVNASAAIARSKLASGTASHVLINDGSGVMSSEANLAVTRGGTGAATLTVNNVILGNGTSAVQFVAPGTSGNILTSNGTTWASSTPAAVVDTSVNGFRLTLTSGTPVTTSDVTGATTMYATPFKSNRIALYDGSNWNIRTSAEFSLALGTLTSGRPYDVFCYDNAGTPTLEFLVWTNDTTRATAIVFQDGVYVKSGATTRRYMGTFYTTSTTTTEDSAQFRYLFNASNQVNRHLLRRESTASWTYNIATIRQANNSTSNQVEVMNGLDLNSVEIHLLAIYGATGSGDFANHIGLDSATTPSSTGVAGSGNLNNATRFSSAHYFGNPGVGRHYFTWLEAAVNGGTSTFYGQYTGVVGNTHHSGLFGKCVF